MCTLSASFIPYLVLCFFSPFLFSMSLCLFCLCLFVFFLFTQKTAYGLRISDWSSDVCSSDLRSFAARARVAGMSAADSAGRIDDLLDIMARLRDPDGGCPWDLQQTFATIAPYTIEEAYEVADAIDRNDLADLRDELGDLLLQVVFHARMAQEQGAFARSEEHTPELQSLMRTSYAVFCLKKKK